VKFAGADRERPTKTSRSASVEFLGIGQGDAIRIRLPEGERALGDARPHKEVVVNYSVAGALSDGPRVVEPPRLDSSRS
jgi:hypothetical protein